MPLTGIAPEALQASNMAAGPVARHQSVPAQYIERALAYALSYVSQPDQGASQGKNPDASKTDCYAWA